MSSAVYTFVQPITEPLDGLHSHFSQLAEKHRDANDLLRSHANDLLSSGSSNGFTGDGATAFSSVVNYYVNTSEKHAQALDDAATTVRTCHTNIMDATDTASSASLHEGLTHKVLAKVTHNDIIQNGGDSIQAVVSDLMSTLSDMKHTAGGFLSDVFSGNLGAAWGDVGQEFSDVGQLVSDVSGLLHDIGNVLGQWASTICDVVGKCLKFIGTALWDVVDFVFDFSGIINDVKTLFDPKKSLWDKILAGGDLILNVGMDVLMVTGIGETLRAGELAVKGIVDIGEKLLDNGGKDILVNLFKGDGTKLMEKVADLEGDNVFRTLDPELQDIMKKTQQITSDSAKKLADLTKQAMEKGDQALEDAVDGYKDLGPKTQKYLQRITRDPIAKTWKMAYGYAIQELSEKEMVDSGLNDVFKLAFDEKPKSLSWLDPKTPGGARPDVLMNLGDATWNIFDWTAEKSSGKILKYTSDGVKYLIEYLYQFPMLP